MKNIKLILLIVGFSISTFSCVDYLDVKPENQVLLEDMWKSESDVEAVLLACYRSMQEEAFMSRLIVWGELRSDNVIAENADDNEKKIHQVNILPANADCSWEAFYKTINYCNTVLKYAPDVVNQDPDFTKSKCHVKEAEAMAIRALCYFYLVRTFRNVPLTLEAIISDQQPVHIAQSSPEAILEKITADLLQAEEWAMNEYPTAKESKGRMTKDAIRALLADVYLWRGNYEKCIEYCDKLIDATVMSDSRNSGLDEKLPKYDLEKRYISEYLFYRGNSSESIFELQFSTETTNKQVETLYGKNNTMGKLTASTFCVETQIVFPETDERKKDFILTTKSNAGEYMIFKYLGYRNLTFYSFRSTPANWIFYRITDIMLMKSEALVQLNRSENDLRMALTYVNKTYMRANSTLIPADSLAFDNYSNVPEMEKLVVLERQRELMFEGKRWFDLVRLSERKGNTIDLVGYVLNKYTSNISTISSKLGVMNALYLPVYAEELKVNPLLKQNPYYDSSSNIIKN